MLSLFTLYFLAWGNYIFFFFQEWLYTQEMIKKMLEKYSTEFNQLSRKHF